jgi:Xaa-Pro aminopeptidase
MQRAAAAAEQAGLAGVLAAPGPDLRYLTGYTPVAAAERLMVLAIRRGEEPVLVLPGFERDGAEDAGAPVTFVEWADGDDPYAKAATLLGPGRYAISDGCWALHALELQRALDRGTLVPVSVALPLLRAVKDADELERMARAGAAVDAAFNDLLEVPFAGRSERDVAADLDGLLRDHGHERVDFTLVGSGPNGAKAHHDAGPRTIEPGDVVVLDFGGFVGGYGSDTTRTVHVGEPTPEHVRVHDIVRDAQQAAVAAVRPGVPAQDVDRAAREHIDAAGYGERFNHRTGHGIGLETHEPPYIVAGNAQALEPGMCFSVEPGIYLPGEFGVRIEDIVAVTDDGVRSLNTATHEMQIVS